MANVYTCVCSYPYGPHLLHCVNYNARLEERAALKRDEAAQECRNCCNECRGATERHPRCACAVCHHGTEEPVTCPQCGEEYLRCGATDEGILHCADCRA